MGDWIAQNIDKLIQLVATITSAIAAFFSWQAVRIAMDQSKTANELTEVTKQEAIRSRQAFQYTWEPLLEVSFEVRKELEKRDQQLTLPSKWFEFDEEVKALPSDGQLLVRDFYEWRRIYGEEQFQNLPTPHPNANYLVMVVSNLQEALAGQAVSVKIMIDFEYADPSHGPHFLENNNAKKVSLLVKSKRIGAGDKGIVWLADVARVPQLRVSVNAIACKTWGSNNVLRGIGGIIDLRNPGVLTDTTLIDNQPIPLDEACIIELNIVKQSLNTG